jgi:hypothetical protein
MRDLLGHRGGDHVHYALDVPNNVALGMQSSALETAKASASEASQLPSSQGQACYDAKLRTSEAVWGEEAPISNEVMNERRRQCVLPPV